MGFPPMPPNRTQRKLYVYRCRVCNIRYRTMNYRDREERICARCKREGSVCFWLEFVFSRYILPIRRMSVNNIKTILRKIIGRIKQGMTNILLTMGTIMLPLSFYLIVEVENDVIKWTAVVLGISSIAVLIISMLFVRKEEKQDRQERLILVKTLLNVGNEIKGFRQDFNEHNNNKSD